ncbi:MAG: type II toxin-antitoxin system VapC family toxin [Micrococcales bacterium]
MEQRRVKAPGLVLDSSILVSLERGAVSPEEIFRPKHSIYVPSVVYAEMLVGFSLDKNINRAADNRASLDDLIQLAELLPFTATEAESYSEIMHFMRITGTKRTPIDTMIAATAKAHDATILTHDRAADFAGLPGVKVEEV